MNISKGDSFIVALKIVDKNCNTFLFNSRQIIVRDGLKETIIKSNDGIIVSSINVIRRQMSMLLQRKWFRLNGKHCF